MRARLLRFAWASLLGLPGALSTGCPAEQASNPPRGPAHVVLITLDTTRPDHLPSYGYGKNTAPNLRALGEEGIVFKRFVITSSWTLPTHASLFTGLFPTTHGAHYTDVGNANLSEGMSGAKNLELFQVNRLPQDAVTLAEVLEQQGYTTIGVGAGPWLKRTFGLSQGFRFYDSDFQEAGGRRAEAVTALAVGFLREAKAADDASATGPAPVFLFANYFDPHTPYDITRDEWMRFLEPGAKGPRARALAKYDAEIFYMDQHIGDLFRELRELGIYDNSWIVVTSDHGEHFGAHGLHLHGFSLYEGVVSGVLMVKPPLDDDFDVDPNERSQSVDIMPTLLSALQVSGDVPAMEGQPLGSITHPAVAELFRNEGNVDWRGERFDRSLRALYRGNHKLIVSTRLNDPDAGLFDLGNDPAEKTDLQRERPDILQALHEELDTWEGGLLPPLTASPVDELDAATRDQLEALGYAPGRDD